MQIFDVLRIKQCYDIQISFVIKYPNLLEIIILMTVGFVP